MKWGFLILILFLSTSLLLGGCATAPYDKWVQEVQLVPRSQPPLPQGVSRKRPTDPPSFLQIGCEGDWDPQNGVWVCVLSKDGSRELNPVPRSQPPLPQGVSRKRPTDPPSLDQIGCKGKWDPRNGIWVGVPTPPPRKQETSLGGGPCYGYPFMGVPFGPPFMFGPFFPMAPYGNRFC